MPHHELKTIPVVVLLGLLVTSACAQEKGQVEKQPRVDAAGFPLPDHALCRLGSLQFREGDEVRCLSFSDDGKQLFAVGGNSNRHVWDTTTGKEIAFSRGGGKRISRFSLSPNRKVLEISDDDTSFVDADSGKVLLTIKPVGVVHLSFSPSSGLVATALVSGKAAVWDLKSGKHVAIVDGKEDFSADRVSFSPVGNLLAFTSEKGAIVLWDMAQGKRVRELVNKKSEYTAALCFSADGKSIAAVQGFPKDSLRVWHVGTGELTHESKLTDDVHGWGESVRVIPCSDGTFYLGEQKSPDLLRSPFADKPACRLARPNGWDASAVAFSPDGQRVATGDAFGIVRLWDTSSGKLLFPGSGKGDLENYWTEVEYSKDGKHVVSWNIYLSPADNRTYHVWDSQTGKHVRSITVAPGLERLQEDWLSHFNFADGTVQIRDVITGATLFQQRYPDSSFWTAHVSPDSNTIAILTQTRNKDGGRSLGEVCLELFDIKAKKIRRCQFPLEGEAGAFRKVSVGARFTPDGKTVLLSLELERVGVKGAQVVHFWDVQSGDRRSTLQLPLDGSASRHSHLVGRGRYYKVERKEGEQLVSYLWDYHVGQKVQNSDSTSEYFNWGIEESPDGKLEAVTKPHNLDTCYIRDPLTGKVVHELRMPDEGVDRASFSPNSRLVAVGTRRGDIHLFDAASGKEVTKLSGHRGLVRALSFSPDGRRLASSSTDTTSLVWDLSHLPKEFLEPRQ